MSREGVDVAGLIEELGRFPAVLRVLTAGLSREGADRSPGEGVWSIRAVALHLVLEEREDFRPRLRSTLEDPGRAWEKIDPEASVRRDLAEAPGLADLVAWFEAERAESVKWLRSLDGADWSSAYQHPSHGPIYAADLLVSWSAHDWLHARQIVKRRYEGAIGLAPGSDHLYAGQWGA